MPRGDMTGPAGYGPMTGRAAGYCAGHPAPGYANWGGRGLRGGRGRGWRRGGRFWGTPYTHVHAPGPYAYGPMGAGAPSWQPDQAGLLQFLKNEAKRLEQILDGISQRISELEGPEKAEETEG